MWFRKTPSGSAFLAHAERLADLFSLMPGITAVALTGSLARIEEQEHANDIDLVLFHDGTLDNLSFSIVRGKEYDCMYGVYSETDRWELKQGESILKRLFGDRSHPIRRYITDYVPCKVDIFCANAAVLTDCDALRQFSTTCRDPEFANRIFCEVSLRKFDVFQGKFLPFNLLHKDGLCCKPRVPWETARKLRQQGNAEVMKY